MIDLHLLQLDNVPIYDQLAMEEAFLRADNRNVCIINSGSPPAIVMGISGKAENFVDGALWKQSPVPLIKRFSGGGTVFVDASTVFVTWIFNSGDIGVEGCPRAIHKWSEKVYQQAFLGLNMSLQENDYVIGERKFGGNAQYLTKGRWLHHSSFLWDYDPERMRMLVLPKKRPAYRKDRPHDEFLCKLRDHFATIEEVREALITSLKLSFRVQGISKKDIKDVLARPHRKSLEFNAETQSRKDEEKK